MRKSVLLSLMFIGGILGLVGFSMASFIDQETQSAQITAGTLDLEPDGDTVTCELSTASNTCDFTYVNEGSLTGSLWVYGYLQGYACTDEDFGANDGTEYCDDTADFDFDSLGTMGYCGTFGTWSVACPITDKTLVDFLNSSYCVNIDTAVAPDEEVDGSFTFNLGSLTNAQQGDALVISWNLYFTDSTSSTAPTECTTFVPPPSI